MPDQAARLVEQAARIDDTRTDRHRDGSTFVVDRVAAIADALSPVEAARMGNRLRRTGDAERGIRCTDVCPPGCGVDPVPAVAPGEVWDARPYVWEHAGVFTTVTAVTVTAGLYLEGFTHPCQTSQDWWGDQVVARSTRHGLPDVYAVFWRVESTGPYDRRDWQWITRELSADAVTAWSGLPLSLGSIGRPGGRAPVAAGLSDWLSSLVG